MNKEDIIRMAREACDQDMGDIWNNGFWVLNQEELERFADLVVAAERERIISANAPEIEAINAHIKALEDAVAAEREACAAILDANADRCVASSTFQQLLKSNAVAIRARGNHANG